MVLFPSKRKRSEAKVLIKNIKKHAITNINKYSISVIKLEFFIRTSTYNTELLVIKK